MTAVQAGTYTLHYQVEAGLDGKAKAVTADGGAVKGEFVVTISDKAPKATVNGKGQVVTKGGQGFRCPAGDPPRRARSPHPAAEVAIDSGGPRPTSTTSSTTTSRGLRQARRTGGRARRSRLTKIGDFDAPVYVTAPLGRTPTTSSSSSRAERSSGYAGRLHLDLLDISGEVAHRRRAGPALDGVRSRLRRSRPVLRRLHGPDGDTRVVEYTATDGTVADSPRADAARSRPASRTTTAASCSSTPTAALRRHRRRRQRRRSQRQRADLWSLLGKILRIDRRQPAATYTIPPATRSSTRRTGRDPEIFAYGLRNPWRFSFDRQHRRPRRSATSARTPTRRSTSPRRRGDGPARTTAGTSTRACTPTRGNADQRAPRDGSPVTRVPAPSDGVCSITGGYVVRDPALPELAGPYLYGDICNGDCAASAPGPASRRARTTRARARRSPTCRASARTAAAASTPRRSAAPSTGLTSVDR